MTPGSNNKPPVKILYCIDQLVRGGTELQLIGLINRLDRSRYTPYLLTLRPTSPELIPENCSHISLDVPKLFSFSGLRSHWWLVRFLRRERIQVVQTYFQDSTVFAGLAARMAMTPVRIACLRDLAFWNNRKQTLLLKSIYPLMTAYICNARVVVDHFSRHFGIDRTKAIVVRNGVDTAQLPFVDHAGSTCHIGIVGNMTRAVKRTDLFIKAAALVHQGHPHIQWHVVGDGHMRAELEQLATDLGVRKHMIFVGRIDDVTGYLAKLDVGVICSDSEGLSNALLEYMFRGVAAVATAVGGNTELIEDGVTGLTVPTDSSEALAKALTRLVEEPDLRQQLALKARARVENSYSWPRCLAEHDGLYQRQLANQTMERLA
ncbi:glycosyltransferase [Marinobacter sp. GN3S48]|uniref:glycosyltransferase n=1 Tax=Marinobacter sp. GN3S48 TaxID=3382302 RepID=UPI00387B92BC